MDIKEQEVVSNMTLEFIDFVKRVIGENKETFSSFTNIVKMDKMFSYSVKTREGNHDDIFKDVMSFFIGNLLKKCLHEENSINKTNIPDIISEIKNRYDGNGYIFLSDKDMGMYLDFVLGDTIKHELYDDTTDMYVVGKYDGINIMNIPFLEESYVSICPVADFNSIKIMCSELDNSEIFIRLNSLVDSDSIYLLS